MDIHFNIAEFLGLDPEESRQTNRKINEMVYSDQALTRAGVKPFELKQLVYNKAKSIKRSTLAALMEYVLRKKIRNRSEVRQFLGGLFEIAPENIWSLLSERSRVELCMGVRTATDGDHFVTAADSLLQAVVMNRMTEKPDTPEKKGGASLGLRLIRTWSNQGLGELEIQKDAQALYKGNFEDIGGSIALLHVGTVKSCPTIEMTVSRAFREAEAFSSEDDVKRPSDRSCPLAIIYRDSDPQPPSCHAGEKLAYADPGEGPGMYYETMDPETGAPTWKRLPWDEKTDCAMVFYRYIKSPARVEMILGGYSGRATRCLAEYLASDATKFWPPNYSDGELDVGIFFVQFEFHERQDRKTGSGLDFPKPSKVHVIPLETDVIDCRVRRHRAEKPDNDEP